MTIRWDSVMVRCLVAELDAMLGGMRLRALRLDGHARDVALLGREHALLWRLHPRFGSVSLQPPVDPEASDIRLKARVRRVSAPADERILRIELMPERSGRPLDLIVELIPNQWNAAAVDLDGVIRHVLTTRDRPREFRVGAEYEPPRASDRAGADGSLTLDAWVDLLTPVAPEERPRAMVRSVAWTSPLNSEWILGGAARGDRADDLADAFGRWTMIAAGPPDWASLDGAQPYPFSLGIASERAPGSFFDALAEAAGAAEHEEDAAGLAVPPDVQRRLRDRLNRARRRATRLAAELDETPEPTHLRSIGDLILARIGSIDTKADRLRIEGFDGGTVEIEWDPSVPPHKNADRFYDRAGRAERARARLPEMIADAEAEAAEWERLTEAARSGDIDTAAVLERLPATVDSTDDPDATLPYRTFRSSGGLEIRVGRGARHNDALTFHHSAPSDVWMHVQQTPGAHVILRWSRGEAPPARDLEEAASLAALHSKARTSATVPVAWTRRKYVRKPRGSAPGSVVPDRVKTIFVEPDETLLERLAD